MKTQFFRVCFWSLGISSLVLCWGWQQGKAQTDVPVGVPIATAQPADLPAASPDLESTNALPAQPRAKVVQAPVVRDDIQASPALAEVIKLAQSGVGDDVMLSYIANSSQPFSLNSDQIVYLNDLGVSSTVITSLIQHRPSAGEVAGDPTIPSPLPPGFALTTPAANVYPGSYASQTVATPPQVPDLNVPNTYETAPPVAVEAPEVPPDFDSSLSPYGSWIDVEGYGRCWQPTVAVASPAWRPYCDRGHWVWTDCGWYWYSDYSWGWAPFHYGRWCTYPRLGWFWVPDACWGPSWVSWRHTSSYCGWAPLPSGVLFVSGQGFFHHGVRLGFHLGDLGLSAGLFTFVPVGHLHDRSFHNYRATGSQALAIYKSSTVINNYTVNSKGTVINHGIGVDRVAQASGHRIPTVAIQTARPSANHIVAGTMIRHEQLQNNGSVLTLAHPQASLSPRSARVSPANQAGSTTDPLARRSVPLANASSFNPNVTPRSAPPTVKAAAEKPAPAASQWKPQPRSANTTARTDQSNSRSPVIPQLGQRTAAPQQPSRTLNVTPQPASRSDMYRVYADPGVVARPANPRFDSPAPQFGHASAVFASPAGPTYTRPQYTPSPAAPSYHSEGSRNPGVRSDSGHSAVNVPSVSHAAPSVSSHTASAPSYSGSGSKSGKN